MEFWTALLDVVTLLAAALLLGALCERVRLNAIIGYLAAGTLLGPNALNLIWNHAAVGAIAELGVALLLFTIGLEFSWRRLRNIGPMALGGGTLQIVLTGLGAAALGLALGLPGPSALAVGAMIAMSSTACVLRLLTARTELDAVHGRHALGILLLQDAAVVPLVLAVTILGRHASEVHFGIEIARAGGGALLLAGSLYVLLTYVAPRLLAIAEISRNRELAILLAIVTFMGAA